VASARRHDRRARRWLAAAGAGALLAPLLPLNTVVATAATPTRTTLVNDPPIAPHTLDAFPARDFLSANQQQPGDTVVFEVTHAAVRGGQTVASKPFVVGDDGLAEVNHPGGTCWDVVTPNIVAGDIVRVVVVGSPDPTRVGLADQTTVADITAGRPANPAPGTITVKGTAQSSAGTQLPAGAIDGRLVAPNKIFAKSGKRDLRAPGTRGATFAYDEPGSTTNFAYTATWTGLTDADVKLALGAQSMGSWLGRNPAAGTESTVYETGAGIAAGPAAPCTAPKEKLAPLPGQDAEAPSQPTGLLATVSDVNTVTLTWDAATDNVGVADYGVYRNGVPIFTVQNGNGSAPAPTTFVDRNVPPGDYTYTVDAADAIDNRSAESAPASATTQAKPAPPVPVVEPPTHLFTLFPSRDMVDVEGVGPDQTARVEVLRDGRVVTDASGLFADDAGLVEINHVGTNCWSGTTPELRTNDTVRATVYDADGTIAWAEQATVANIVTRTAVSPAPGVIEVHGRVAGHDGSRLPIEQIDHRLVSSTAVPFSQSGKRSIRADSTGTLQGKMFYDPIDPVTNPDGTAWTARYTGLDDADVKLAQKVDSIATWLGRDPVAGTELTIYEAGSADPPGPATPDCASPIEPIDTAAPSAPSLSATAQGADREVDLAWTPAHDDTYVYGYRVFQDGKQIAVLGGDATAFTATGVGPGQHRFAVEAFDSASAHGAGATDVERLQAGIGTAYGNTSARGESGLVTMPDVQKPSAPGNLQVTNPTRTVTNPDGTTSEVSTTNARLVFDPSTDDGGTVAKYRVYRNGVLLAGATPTLNTAGKYTYTDTKLTQGTTYRYAVDAVDGAGNASDRSAEISVTIAQDNESPVFTGDPVATVPDIHGRDVVITWPAATDNVGVTGYGIYRDGTRIASVDGSTLSFRDVGLAPGTYRYKVDAVDSAGNRSDRAAQPNQTAAIANDPPASGHTVTAYPARDFVDGLGYVATDATGATVGQKVVVEVFRGGKIVGQARTTADNTGLVEVNHAGPGCWGTAAFANTPDIRTGDVVRITPLDTGVPDQTTVSGVYVGRPTQTGADTVVVKGTAADAAGKPLPLDQLEARMLSDGAAFRLSGKKQLRAPGDGTVAYDAAGSTSFTATFKGLVGADVTTALAGEMVINWLGRAPLANAELTIFENGPGTDGGPAAGTTCTAPLDPTAPLVALTPATRLAFGNQNAVPASTSTARPVTLTNAGSTPVSLTKVYLAGANRGDFAVSPGALPASLAVGASVTVNVTFSPKAVGARSATLNFTDNAANTSYQTIDLTGSGTDAAAPSTPTGLARALTVDSQVATVAAPNSGRVPVKLTWTASTGAVSRYQVQVSVAGGAFADVPADQQPAAAVVDPDTGAVTTPAANGTTVQVATGSQHRYQVRACNGTNCSAYSALSTVNLTSAQENQVTSTRGTWTRSALAGAFGGQVSSNAAAGSTISWKATTPLNLAVVSTKGPDRGNAEVWIDGARVGTVNLYADTTKPSTVVFVSGALTAGKDHEVELRPLGTRTAPSAGNRVDLDAFVSVR
jgi:Abnormal spindle-like microcephaly-assoc'd, ASPM-SPD-2-Hydin